MDKKNGIFKKSTKNVLQDAVNLYGKRGEEIRDQIGLIGYKYDDFILVAKPNPYGYIVSCNESLLNYGKKYILFYIGKNKAFYKFDVKELLDDPDTFTNYRGKIPMLNFSIKLGKREE